MKQYDESLRGRNHRTAALTPLAALEQLLWFAFANSHEREPVRPDGPFRGWTAAEFLAWLENQPPEFDRKLHDAIWRRPDREAIGVSLIKELRAIAKDRAPVPVRRHAERLLKESGFDDESLRNEDEPEGSARRGDAMKVATPYIPPTGERDRWLL